MTRAGWPLWLAVSLTLLLGLLCGLINAALIHYTGISPLVITLGTLYLYGGGALLLSGMAGATGYEDRRLSRQLHRLRQFNSGRAAAAAGAVRGYHLSLLAAGPSRALWPPPLYSGKTRAPRAMRRCR